MGQRSVRSVYMHGALGRLMRLGDIAHLSGLARGPYRYINSYSSLLIRS